MTTINEVLRWPSGRGWIVLSGGNDASSEVRAQVLHRARAMDVGVAYIGLSESSSDDTMDDMDDLGAPAGFLVNVLMEDDDTIRDMLEPVSVIVVDEFEPLEDLRNSLPGAGTDGMRTAYERGAVILFEGDNAALLGTVFLNVDGELQNGLDWIEHTLILPGTTSLADSEAAHYVLESEPDAVVIGIGRGSALVLGPDGMVEIWGRRQVAIALGRNYQTE
jgi:hypothetical protein